MNKVMGFIKGNLIIVISIVLILAFLPAGYIFSGKWNKKVHTQVEDSYNSEKRAMTSSGKVNYALPAVLEGEADLSETRAPNAAVTRFYQQAKEARQQQVADVVERGTSFNRGDHVELVPGLLPDSPDPRTRARLGRAMSEAIVGTETSPSVYQRKLQRLNAGGPPSPEVLEETLKQAKEEMSRRLEGTNADGNLTEDQKKQLDDAMVARRLSEYIGRAKSLTFFASTDAIVNGNPVGEKTTIGTDGYSIVPAKNWNPSDVTPSVAFTWLWDYWIISDVLDAAALANTNAASGAMSIPEAPVKRIEAIRVSGLEIAEAPSEDDQSGFGGGRGRGGMDPETEVEPPSITNRVGGEPGSAFDLRTVDVVAVVSSKDLPKFIDAIGKVNFMTVIDMDIRSVDIWGDLEQGYYYGDDHVVRVALKIETVWLRSWLSPLMPNPVKATLGIPVEQALDDPEG